jgi:hypothetical protein
MGNMKMTIMVTLALGASVASADKLSDFKEAVANKGCEGIPYSDYRSSCQSQQSQVHDWCDGPRGPVTCVNEVISRQVKDNLEKEKRTVQELRDKRGKLQDSKSRASTDDEKNQIGKDIEQVEKDIYEGDKRVEQAQKDLETRKKLVDDAIYTLDQCIAYRRGSDLTLADIACRERGNILGLVERGIYVDGLPVHDCAFDRGAERRET